MVSHDGVNPAAGYSGAQTWARADKDILKSECGSLIKNSNVLLPKKSILSDRKLGAGVISNELWLIV